MNAGVAVSVGNIDFALERQGQVCWKVKRRTCMPNGAKIDAFKLDAAKNRKKYATATINPFKPIAKPILGNAILPKSLFV